MKPIECTPAEYIQQLLNKSSFSDDTKKVDKWIKENFISKKKAKKELKQELLAEFYGDDDLSNKKYEKLLKRINKRINKVLKWN